MPLRIGTCTVTDRYTDGTGYDWSFGDSHAMRCSLFPCASQCDPKPAVRQCGPNECVPQSQLLTTQWWVRA